MPIARILAFLAALLCLSISPSVATARTVVVVYDNSGSMDGCPRDDKGRITSPSCDNRYAYASYSLQTLRALIGAKDDLSVVFTSTPGVVWRNGINNSSDISHLRDVTSKPKGNTPHSAVEKALEVIKGSKDPDRWLVMITDGQFQAKEDVRQMVDGFLAEHSRGLKVLLLGLGEGVNNSIFEIWKEKAGAKTYFAKAANDIREQMQQIAAIVTSNTDRGIPVEAKGTTITFTPRFPLRRFTLLQQTAAAGKAATTIRAQSGSIPLDLSSPLTTQTPMLGDLYGTVSQVRGQAASLIPAGVPITVSFDRQVDMHGLTVLPEVDARLEVTLTDETGQPVQRNGAVYNACLEHNVFIEVRLVGSSGTALESAGTKAKVEYGGKPSELSWDPTRKAFTGSVTVIQGTLPFRVEVVNVGYIYAVDAGQIRSKNDCPPREIFFSAFQGGKPVTKWSENVMGLNRETTFELVPFIDGRPMTKQEAANWKCSADSGSLPLDIRPTGNGGWRFTPKERWCTPCLTPTGNFPVRASVGSSPPRNGARDILLTLTPTNPLTGKDKVTLPQGMAVDITNPGILKRCWKFALSVLAALAFLWWLFGVVRKNRFAGGASIEYQRGGPNPRKLTEPLKSSFASRWLTPYRPESKTIEGIKFKAGGRGNYVIISKESLAAGMRVAGERMDEQSILKDKNLGNSEKIQIEGAVPKTYTYFN